MDLLTILLRKCCFCFSQSLMCKKCHLEGQSVGVKERKKEREIERETERKRDIEGNERDRGEREERGREKAPFAKKTWKTFVRVV